MKPVNIDALSKWVGQIPEDVVKDMDVVCFINSKTIYCDLQLAPMLETLGYDPNANPPNYGQPDAIVAKKTDDVHKNGKEWYRKAVGVVNDPDRVDKPFGDQ